MTPKTTSFGERSLSERIVDEVAGVCAGGSPSLQQPADYFQVRNLVVLMNIRVTYLLHAYLSRARNRVILLSAGKQNAGCLIKQKQARTSTGNWKDV